VPIATRIDPMETTLDRPVKPTADGPGRPVVASVPVKPAERPSTGRSRPQSAPTAPVVASKPSKRPTGLAKLQHEWNGLVSLDDSLTERCVEINVVVDSLEAERKSIAPSLRKDVNARLAEAYREMERLGAECRRVEARMNELKAAMGS
jgi:hypothetical protein